MDNIKLRNCPFCESKPIFEKIESQSNVFSYFISCKNKQCAVMPYLYNNDKDKSIKLWNCK